MFTKCAIFAEITPWGCAIEVAALLREANGEINFEICGVESEIIDFCNEICSNAEKEKDVISDLDLSNKAINKGDVAVVCDEEFDSKA